MSESGCMSSVTAYSVSRLTVGTQDHLRGAQYPHAVNAIEPPKTPSDRVAYAIEHSGKTLEEIAEKLGCTHATLSQWQTGMTNVANAKAGLLYKFAELTGTDVRWILTGQGPAISRYTLTSELTRLGAALRAMERKAPQQVETIVRMVEAAAGER